MENDQFQGSADAAYPSSGDPYVNSSQIANKEKTLQEEQTDPLDFSCGGGSSSEQLIHHQQGFDHVAASANKAIAHPYAFGRSLHPDYTAERSFYYRDNLGNKHLKNYTELQLI